MQDAETATNGASYLGYVLAVNLVIWIGLFLYLLRLGGRIRRLERRPRA